MKKTKKEKVLEILQRRKKWATGLDFVKKDILCYRERIRDLIEIWYNITHRDEKNKKTNSRYRRRFISQ